ncbi:hypothetical protein K2P56_02955 [Patescibacteria group bacterium]|nr:hypothetical protein [Patescibacteria group bacterium]
MVKNVFVVVIGLLLMALTYAWWQAYTPARALLIGTFEECVAAGNPVMETYPPQCRTPDGRLFVSSMELPQYAE